ncbi:hypothetical protein [Kutzneria viridogrisea]
MLLAATCALAVLAPPAAAHGTHAHEPSSVAGPADENNLRQGCQAHNALADRQQGWARNRFEQCYHFTKVVNLFNSNHEYMVQYQWEEWILAFAYDGSRRVDYVVSVENAKQSKQLFSDIAFLTIGFNGCDGQPNISCSGTLARSSTIEDWYHSRVWTPSR